MMRASEKIIDAVLFEVQCSGEYGVKARTISRKLGIEKASVNRILYFVLKSQGKIYIDDRYFWRLACYKKPAHTQSVNTVKA